MKDLGAKRNVADAPESLTKTGVKDWLVKNGAAGIISAAAAANIVGCSKRIIKNAEKDKQLKSVSPGVYLIDDLCCWLISKPKYLAQGVPRWEITLELREHVKRELLARFNFFVRNYKDGLEDLISEVCLIIAKKKKLKTVQESTVINSAIIDLWRKYNVANKNQIKTISTEKVKGIKCQM